MSGELTQLQIGVGWATLRDHPPPAAEPTSPSTAATRVTIELDGRTDAVDHHAGTTILQTAREMGYDTSVDADRPFVEVSGRKGLGVKADDLLDRDAVAAREA